MRDFNYGAAAEFLAQFFSGTEHAVEIRALPNEHGAGPVRPLFTRDPDLVLQHCIRWDQLERAIYFGVATRTSGIAKGAREHIQELPALWCDIDCYKLGITTDEAIAALQSFAAPPSVIVLSGGGVHAYWLLLKPLNVSQADPTIWPAMELAAVGALKQLAGVFAGDIAVCDLARVMRLPGTHNTKDGTLRRCEAIASSTWARIDFEELVELLDRQAPLLMMPVALRPPAISNPWIEHAKAFTFGSSTDVKDLLAKMKFGGTPPNSINITQRNVAAKLAYRGVPEEEILTLLLSETRRVAIEAGVDAYWNWSREEAQIRKMIVSGDRKFSPVSGTMRATGTVVELRSGGARPVAVDEPEVDTVPADGSYVRNDIGNAFSLIDQHGSDLRYVLGIGWHVWDGKRYALDAESVVAQRLAHNVSAKMLKDAADMPSSKARSERIKWAISSGNKSRISGMLDQAKSYIHSEADALDADPMILNCANGTIDLQSLELRPHKQSDLLTKLCPVEFDLSATCPIWERFLSEIFDGDDELVSFVQRAIGYSLTGRTDEQVIFIMHGAGSNGKSVLLETIAAVLADYVKRSPAETWISKPYSGPSNDLAALAGARFVSVIETEQDKALAEALVKQATGGDAMTVRFLHKEFFSFTPKFKLWFATNHKPRIRGSEYAIWRRILLLPFVVTFVDADKVLDGQKAKDPDLKNKLADEYPGILAWMLRGCAAWQADGLRPPDAVRLATEGYQDSQDNVSAFIRDNCHISRGLTCSIGLLYAGYQIWCDENEETPLSKRLFASNLDERGFPAGPRTKQARLRKGIDLKEEFRYSADLRLATPVADG